MKLFRAGGASLRRVLGNAGLLLSGRAVNAVLGLAYIALAARGLGVHVFGVLVLIHAFAQFLGDVAKFQSWQTVLHYGAAPLLEGRRADFQKVLRFTLALDVGSSLAVLLLGTAGALLFAERLGWPGNAGLAAAYVTSTVFMVSATPLGLLRLFDRFDLLARQTALVSVVRLAGAMLAFFLEAPLWAYLLVWASGTAASFVYLLAGAWRELVRRDLIAGFAWRGPLAGDLPGAWRFAWTTNLSASLEVAFTHVATLIVGALLGPGPAALWRVGRQVADALAKPARLLIPALYPELARLRADSGEAGMWRLALQVALVAGGAGFLLLSVAAVAGAPLLGLIMGEGFAEAAGAMTWQVAAAVIAIFALPLEPMLVTLGRPQAALRVRLAVSAVFLTLLPWAVERWGVHGAGAALTGAATALALGMLAYLWQARRTGRADQAAPRTDAPMLNGD